MFLYPLTRSAALLKLDVCPPGADDGRIERFPSLLLSDQLCGVLKSYSFRPTCALWYKQDPAAITGVFQTAAVARAYDTATRPPYWKRPALALS